MRYGGRWKINQDDGASGRGNSKRAGILRVERDACGLVEFGGSPLASKGEYRRAATMGWGKWVRGSCAGGLGPVGIVSCACACACACASLCCSQAECRGCGDAETPLQPERTEY